MSELTLTLMRLGLLVMLWLFIFGVISVVRTDIYGVKVSRRAQRKAAARRQAAAAAPIQAPVRPAGPQQGPPPPPAQTGPRSRLSRGPRLPRALVVTAGPLAGTTIPLSGVPVLIGRNPECTLVLDDDYASGRHCRIAQTNEGWTVEDLGSTNGTFLDRRKLQGTQPLDSSSVLQIGKTVIEVRD